MSITLDGTLGITSPAEVTGPLTATSITGLTTPLSIAQGGTGSTTNVGTAYALKGANADITSLSSISTPLSVAQGGTGATSLASITVGTATTATTANALNTANNYTVTNLTSTGGQYFGAGVGGVRTFNYYGNEQSWQAPIGTPNVFLNVSDAAGSNGGSYNYWIRGLGSSGSTPATLASINLTATTVACAGAITAVGNITAYYSDDRLKTNLGNIPNALDKVNTLNGFYYEANETAQALGYKPVREVGVSAQQVQAILPEITAPAPIDNQYLTVHYERLVPLLIEAIKELTAKVEALEAR